MVSKPWWNIAVPHKDIREGRLDESVFAAKLGDVVRGRGPLEYRDTEIFFRKTHLTPGLQGLCATVISRLSGGRGEAFIQLQTPFGGGKTHALIALYHLFKHQAMPEEAIKVILQNEILRESRITEFPPAKVAAFVGTEADPIRGLTPWGEIAKQLGNYKLLEEHDKKRVAPGKDMLIKLLEENRPVLILIDELLEYAVKVAGVNLKDITGAEGTLKGQLLSFLQELSEAITSVDRCVVIVTLPSSILEHYDEAAEQTLMQLQKISGRVEAIYTPVVGEEVYEVIRKRLFDDLGDEAAHRKVADEYFEIYRQLGDEIPLKYREEEYKRKIAKAYPFHPEVIDNLYERWSTFPTFQRTRGVLRFLAEVVGDLYKREHPSPLIQPAHINLANTSIRTELIKHIGNQFEGVIASDIIESNGNAVRIDKEMGSEYAKFKVATSLATAIFFYSFSGAAEKTGATVQRLRVAFLREGIPFPMVGDAVKRLDDELYFLHSDKSLYYFLSRANMNRIIIDKEEAVKDEEIEEEIKNRVQKIAGSEFDILVWPKSAGDIAESKKLRLVILHPQHRYGQKTEKFAGELLKKTSTGFRTYQNSIIMLVADSSEYEALKKNTRRFLALTAIKNSPDLMKSLSEEDRSSLKTKLEDADSAVPIKTVMAYRYVIKGFNGDIKPFDMGIPTIDEKPNLSKRVKEYLKDQDLLLDKISPRIIIERTFEKEESEKPYGKIWEAFLSYTHLPILDGEYVFKKALEEGVKSGLLGLSVNEQIFFGGEKMPSTLEDTIVLRPEVARTKIATIEAEVPTVTVTPPITGVTGPPKVEGREPTTLRRVQLKLQVPWDRMSDLVRGVFMPLSREGANITLQMEIDARTEKGMDRKVIDQTVRETLNQIGAKIIEERSE